MSIFKKQGFAWAAAIVMIIAAVAIGRGEAGAAPTPDRPEPVPTGSVEQPVRDVSGVSYYIRDDAGVLSQSTLDTVNDRNAQLKSDMDVGIGVVTCNSGGDLYTVALDYAEDMGLGSYDFIVVLDISGENYWLMQGADLVSYFSDDDCSDYAVTYMERDFAKGNYNSAVLSLTAALSQWYYDNY